MGGAWALVAPHQRLLNENVISFAVSPADPRSIWAVSFDGLLTSADGGKTWVRPKTLLEPEKPNPAVRSRGARNVAVTRRPVPAMFPAAGVRIRVLRFLPGEASAEGAAAGPALLAGTSEGLFISHDGGTYWRKMAFGDSAPPAVLSIFLPA